LPTDPTRLALVIAGLLLVVTSVPTSAHVAFLIATGVLLAIAARHPLRRTTIVFLLFAMIVVRVEVAGIVGSDVLYVTQAAINRAFAGLSPYGLGYQQSTPPGAPFPYGPIALLWYVPLRQAPELMELGAAVLVGLALALRGRLVGLAVYAASSVTILTSIDGSNDTSLGLLVLVAFMAAGRWPSAGAAILGIAVGFKLSALAFVPLYIAWGGIRVAATLLAVTAMAWSPVIGGWGIGNFLTSARMANETHPTSVWTLGKIVNDVTKTRIEVLDQLRFVFGGVVALLSYPLRRSLDGVILGGIAVYLVTLFAGNWATFAYFAGIAPIICWRLDDWLGLPSEPLIREPARFVAPLRQRWPLRRVWPLGTAEQASPRV
jgi:hypothetical protein